MAAGLPLPKCIVAHGWLLFEESKMSKSRGNIVRAETILDVLGTDALRYFLLREVVFGQDGSFSFDALVQRYNSDLANGYGNLVSRTLAMIGKYFERGCAGEQTASRRIDTRQTLTSIADLRPLIDAFDFSRALGVQWAMVAAVDGYLTASAPWKQLESISTMKPAARSSRYRPLHCRRIHPHHHRARRPGHARRSRKSLAQLGLGDIRKPT